MPQIEGAALVTGAAKRIGREIALALAADGHDVVIHYSGSREEANATAAAARAKGVRAEILGADLLDRVAVEGLIDAACQAIGGPLRVLVNNASIFEYDRLGTATYDSWDRHFRSNLEAPFFLMQAFAAQVPPLDEGVGDADASAAVINMIDQRVRKLTPEFATYSLAKSALWTLTQTAAQALAPRIRVNAIAPGPTLKGSRQSEEHFAAQRSATILQRGSSTADIVRAMRFILASQDFTGQLLCVDGGQHLAWQTPDIQGIE